jgi:putative endonuclease
MKKYYVYIISNFNRNVFYIGVTNNLERRTLEHKGGIGSEFTTKYNCHYLLYHEEFGNINNAIEREKQLKNWHREWKINLIKSQNNDMVDLAKDWFTEHDIINVKEIQ